ncbi:MFS transporter [Cysteiniphilum halobium]|uniref:MFS transporter n=1 Tax=Cysteiniphilum halobium TaxID=2219059 RepID=UPI000E64B9F3|nr:MFS transporter [Cysteiniphilum halobium]
MFYKTLRLLKISLGNVIEWYDFSLYGYFAVAIAATFFPSSSPVISLLATFAVFGAGFLARPVGAFVFGHLGDKVGRHYAMNLSIAMMGLATIGMAFLPGVSTIGVMAPVLLVLLRMLQGLSAGGQFGNLLTITTEDDDYRLKGLNIGIAYSVSVIGFLLAAFVSVTVVKLIPHSLSDYAWRIPFLISAVLLIAQVFLKERDVDQDTIGNKDKVKISPIKTVLANHRRSLICVIILSAVAASLFYILATYLVTYMTQHIGLTQAAALSINSLALGLICIMVPLSGLFSDYWGRKKSLNACLMLLMVLSVPAMLLFNSENYMLIIAATVLITALVSLLQGVATPLYSELFPKNVRASGCSIAYGIGVSISGFAPMFADIFVNLSPSYGLIYFIYTLVIIGVITTFYLPHNKVRHIEYMRVRSLLTA